MRDKDELLKGMKVEMQELKKSLQSPQHTAVRLGAEWRELEEKLSGERRETARVQKCLDNFSNHVESEVNAYKEKAERCSRDKEDAEQRIHDMYEKLAKIREKAERYKRQRNDAYAEAYHDADDDSDGYFGESYSVIETGGGVAIPTPFSPAQMFARVVTSGLIVSRRNLEARMVVPPMVAFMKSTSTLLVQ